MSTTSSGHDGDLDLESQQTVLLKPTNSLGVRWRAILLILQVRNKLRACIADKGSLNRSVSSSTSYYSTINSLDDLEEAVSSSIFSPMDMVDSATIFCF